MKTKLAKFAKQYRAMYEAHNEKVDALEKGLFDQVKGQTIAYRKRGTRTGTIEGVNMERGVLTFEVDRGEKYKTLDTVYMYEVL